MQKSSLQSVDTAISFTHKPSLMVNCIICWKCNLDCSYCRWHDNTLDPVELEQCLKSIDFILEYGSIILSLKKPYEKTLAINFIGGEPMLHPEIDVILEHLHNSYQQIYKDQFKLSTVITTNGTAGSNMFAKCINYVDRWTVSYHTESLPRQKEICLQNIDFLQSSDKMLEVRVMAPNNGQQFEEAQQVHSELKTKNVNALLKPITGADYTENQTVKFKTFWMSKHIDDLDNYQTNKGITCCTDRPLVLNRDRKEKTNFIPSNNFKGWYCGVTFHYLYVDHLGDIWHNNACHVSYETNKSEPTGNLANADSVIQSLRNKIANGAVPVQICPNDLCKGCGMCAPKAKTKEEFLQVMKLHLDNTDILDLSYHENSL